jgi:casein kinase 1
MHNREVLHRDIQLGNCAIGLKPEEETIYMIDFGFSKRYIDPYTRRHIPDSKQKRDFLGNYWFTSVNVHCKGKGQYLRFICVFGYLWKLSQYHLGEMISRPPH